MNRMMSPRWVISFITFAEALLELTAVLRAGDERGLIEV